MKKSIDELLSEAEGNFRPTLSHVREFFSTRQLVDKNGVRKTPLIGEERAALQAFLHFVMSEKPVLVKAYSGTGKTVLIDAVLDLIPQQQKYSIQLGSETSVWYNEKEINSAKFIEFPELQKATENPTVIEILKNWGEGKDAKRERTDVTLGDGGETREQLLKWHAFITSAAIGNKKAKPVMSDEEFLRRVMEVRTDPSKGMTERVVGFKLDMWGTKTEEPLISDFEANLLRKHVFETIESAPKKFYNPASSVFKKIVPTVLPISRSFVDNYISINNAVARFYHKEGLVYDNKIYIRPSDMYESARIYMRDFIEGCLKLPLLGREILTAFPERGVALSESIDNEVPDHCKLTSDIVASHLQSLGFVIDKPSVMRILMQLMLNNFLVLDEENKTKRFYRSEYTANYDDNIDWGEIVKACKDNVDNKDYIKNFCGDEIWVIDPITGEKVNILDIKKPVKPKKAEKIDVEGYIAKLDLD